MGDRAPSRLVPGRWYWAVFEPRRAINETGRCVTVFGVVADVTPGSFTELGIGHWERWIVDAQSRVAALPPGADRPARAAIREIWSQLADARIEAGLIDLGSAHRPDQDWQAGVWQRIDRRARIQTYVIATMVGAIVGIAVVIAALLWGCP